METLFRLGKKLLPRKIFTAVQPIYHYFLALLGALIYRFPSQYIKVIAVTGTKGKSSVVELTNAILEEAGYKTAVLGTIRFKIGERSEPNLYKMTVPGRFFLERFLRRAVSAGCAYAVIEMTSEGVRQFRHKFIALDALIFTNLAPEHIESHGSYENYVAAKVSLARALETSPKKNKLLVVNGDDKEAPRFIQAFSGNKIAYSLKDAVGYSTTAEGVAFNWSGMRINSKLPGEFNLYNILAAASFAKESGIPIEVIKRGVEKVERIRGRAERVQLEGQNLQSAKPDFTVIVDYAHTPDSLEKFYQTFAGKFRVCVLGNTGGGRDVWKRPVMGAIADKYCDKIILTNEDPYDEDPEKIIRDVAGGIKHKEPLIILDRREAIKRALSEASKDDYVLITGKGTDPFIMGPNGTKEPWDDATVVREELGKILSTKN